MPLGAHVSIAGGYLEAFKRAEAIGGDALQLFTKSPRGRALRIVSEEESKQIASWPLRKKISFAVIHSSYLLNFAKPLSPDSFEIKSLKDDLLSGDRLGAVGVVVHIGKTLERDPDLAKKLFIENIAKILDQTKDLKSKIILENTAGQGSEMGYRFPEFGELLEGIKKATKERKRLGVCIDTQHLFAAGYDIRTPKGVSQTLSSIEQEIGFETITCVHFNDSKRVAGARVDRHQDIGEGEIGANGLKTFRKELLKLSKRDIPFILETPEEKSDFNAQIKLVRSWKT